MKGITKSESQLKKSIKYFNKFSIILVQICLKTKFYSFINLAYNNLIIINQLFIKEKDSQLKRKNSKKMLPYHTIYPQKRQQNDSEFLHYLSLGSYSTSFTNSNILSFSKITLNPKKYLPKLSYEDLKAKCESQGFKFHTLLIPLYGNFMIDQVVVKNVLQQQVNEKGQENNNNEDFKINQVKFVLDPQYISNKEEKDKNATFLYLLCKISTDGSGSEILHSERLQSQIEQKNINYHPISIGSSSVQISFIQALEDTNMDLNTNDFLYLQKGKVILYLDEQQEKVEIKNKGNRKGQQNYIDNMIYTSEKINIVIEKGSLLFLISTKEGTQV